MSPPEASHTSGWVQPPLCSIPSAASPPLPAMTSLSPPLSPQVRNPSPDKPPSLLDLPIEVIHHICSCCDDAPSRANLRLTSKTLHVATRPSAIRISLSTKQKEWLQDLSLAPKLASAWPHVTAADLKCFFFENEPRCIARAMSHWTQLQTVNIALNAHVLTALVSHCPLLSNVTMYMLHDCYSDMDPLQADACLQSLVKCKNLRTLRLLVDHNSPCVPKSATYINSASCNQLALLTQLHSLSVMAAVDPWDLDTDVHSIGAAVGNLTGLTSLDLELHHGDIHQSKPLELQRLAGLKSLSLKMYGKQTKHTPMLWISSSTAAQLTQLTVSGPACCGKSALNLEKLVHLQLLDVCLDEVVASMLCSCHHLETLLVARVQLPASFTSVMATLRSLCIRKQTPDANICAARLHIVMPRLEHLAIHQEYFVLSCMNRKQPHEPCDWTGLAHHPSLSHIHLGYWLLRSFRTADWQALASIPTLSTISLKLLTVSQPHVPPPKPPPLDLPAVRHLMLVAQKTVFPEEVHDMETVRLLVSALPSLQALWLPSFLVPDWKQTQIAVPTSALQSYRLHYASPSSTSRLLSHPQGSSPSSTTAQHASQYASPSSTTQLLNHRECWSPTSALGSHASRYASPSSTPHVLSHTRAVPPTSESQCMRYSSPSSTSHTLSHLTGSSTTAQPPQHLFVSDEASVHEMEKSVLQTTEGGHTPQVKGAAHASPADANGQNNSLSAVLLRNGEQRLLSQHPLASPRIPMSQIVAPGQSTSTEGAALLHDERDSRLPCSAPAALELKAHGSQHGLLKDMPGLLSQHSERTNASCQPQCPAPSHCSVAAKQLGRHVDCVPASSTGSRTPTKDGEPVSRVLPAPSRTAAHHCSNSAMKKPCSGGLMHAEVADQLAAESGQRPVSRGLPAPSSSAPLYCPDSSAKLKQPGGLMHAEVADQLAAESAQHPLSQALLTSSNSAPHRYLHSAIKPTSPGGLMHAEVAHQLSAELLAQANCLHTTSQAPCAHPGPHIGCTSQGAPSHLPHACTNNSAHQTCCCAPPALSRQQCITDAPFKPDLPLPVTGTGAAQAGSFSQDLEGPVLNVGGQKELQLCELQAADIDWLMPTAHPEVWYPEMFFALRYSKKYFRFAR